MHFDKMLNNIVEGDCLEVMRNIPDKTIDMILCDLPYGYTKNKWDFIIPLDKLWEQYRRIIKKNGTIVLTAQGIFTAELMMAGKDLFKYKMVWLKSKSTNFLNAKKQPLRKHEDILVFYKSRTKPTYNPQMTDGKPYNKGYRKNQQSSSYGPITPVKVISKGQRYPNDVIEDYFEDYQPIEDSFFCMTAEIEGKVYHPTQKPVELGRYLIRTFSNENDIVLDNACGSGSFLVSAALEGRRFIGIEKNEDAYHKDNPVDFINICKERLKEIIMKPAFNEHLEIEHV